MAGDGEESGVGAEGPRGPQRPRFGRGFCNQAKFFATKENSLEGKDSRDSNSLRFP